MMVDSFPAGTGSCCSPTAFVGSGLMVLGGVTGFFLRLCADDGLLLTGSISVPPCSNIEISELVGGIDAASVGISKLVVDELATLYPSSMLSARLRPLLRPPILLLRGVGLTPLPVLGSMPVWLGLRFDRGLGLADRLAAKVAAMKDVDRESGAILPPGGSR